MKHLAWNMMNDDTNDERNMTMMMRCDDDMMSKMYDAMMMMRWSG